MDGIGRLLQLLSGKGLKSGAIAKPPDKGSSHHPGQWHGTGLKAESRHVGARFASCKAVHTRARAHAHRAARARNYDAETQLDGYAGGPADAYVGPVHAVGRSEVGAAAWYNWVGARTASGEVLDTVTATAAHPGVVVPLQPFGAEGAAATSWQHPSIDPLLRKAL